MGKHRLLPHPDYPATSIESVAVELFLSGGKAELHFTVKGGNLSLPQLTASGRADDLWQSTCFELFLRPATSESYFEFNFSPSTQWAAYRLDSYRAGRRDMDVGIEPGVFPDPEPVHRGSYRLRAEVDLSDVPAEALRVGLSAIVEETDGTKSYWALAHPTGDKPDFHDPACFALELPAGLNPSSSPRA